MTKVFNIVEPVLENPLEQFTPTVATETRAKLAELFKGSNSTTGVIKPLSKERLGEIKQKAIAECSERYSQNTAPTPKGGYEDAHATWQVLRCISAAWSGTFVAPGSREVSYAIEYAVGWAKKMLFTHGLKLPKDLEAGLLYQLSIAPHGTAKQVDNFAADWFGGVEEGVLYRYKYAVGLQRYCTSAISTVHTTAGRAYGLEPIGTVYTEEDVAWFAGFLTQADFDSLRFRRVRVAAAVKELTGSDTTAKNAADRLRDVQSFTWKIYPNDVPFGAVYVDLDGHIGSCMSNPACTYTCPNDIHPCDVYSSSYFGAGDNGLALLVAYQGEKPVGRGILNTNNNHVVRWYGGHKAYLMLVGLGIEGDSDALIGSWLARVEDSGRVAGPYLDGGEGEDGGDIIRIVHCGFDMSNTDGYYRFEPYHMCVYDEEEYPESDMTWQPISETWILDENIERATECPMTGEYFRGAWGHDMYIDREHTTVSTYAYRNTAELGYTCLGGNIGYTQDPGQYYVVVDDEYYTEDEVTYDDVTEQYYTNSDYEELIQEREADDEAA